MSFWFGDFELDQERHQLLRSGEPVPLEPKAYELLSLLVETLRSWTNLRAVRDPQSPTGWKLEAGPFPGWAKLPQR